MLKQCGGYELSTRYKIVNEGSPRKLLRGFFCLSVQLAQHGEIGCSCA